MARYHEAKEVIRTYRLPACPLHIRPGTPDADSAEAHVALGQVKLKQNDIDGAEAAFQRSLTLNPNSPLAYLQYAWLMSSEQNRYEEALSLHQQAVELDPLSVDAILTLGHDLQWTGRFDEALAWFEKAIEIDADNDWGPSSIGAHHWFVSGRLDEAVAWMTKSVGLDSRSTFNLSILGRVLLDLGDLDRANYWIHRSIELAPEGFFSNLAAHRLALRRGDETAALDHGRKASAIHPIALTFLRDREVGAGRYVEARALYEEHFPELLDERDPEVGPRNYLEALDLALVLSRTDGRERVKLLLDRSLQQIESRPRLGSRGYQLADVQIYALQGKRTEAVAALRQAIDEGWRAGWWWWLEKPDLEPLHDDPEFQAMVAEIRADMAAQLAHVREMERSGELVFPPEPATPAPIVSGSSRPGPR